MTNDAPGLMPAAYLLIAMVLLAVGSQLFLNLNEDPEIFIIFTLIFTAPGVYLLVAGAVARGIQMARQD
ncbi:hypothetical protein [Nocardioides sp.]|uniref:hypothetical protein n=1 Tax=Nocardioides sp. TaxID=35761 RepID=UPI002C0F52D4|nr:hypothetical protein [Nocardioides sp.]HSX67601.1 hypothetical protein [Nocardioides sp.]